MECHSLPSLVIRCTHRGKGLFFFFLSIMEKAFIKDMLDHAVHIGHKRQFWSAKMRDYVFGVQNGVHVFDLYKTAEKLEALKTTLADLNKAGKSILIVGTKFQARDLVKSVAEETGNYYINAKWVPGLLTNFHTLKKRIGVYNKIEKDLESGALDVLTKKEKSQKMKELEKLKKAYQGIKDLRRVPDVMIVVDGFYETLALNEAKHLGLATYALLGSTGDIDKCTDFVPCNVNSIKSLDFVLSFIKPSLKRDKTARETTMDKLRTKAPAKEDGEEAPAVESNDQE